MFIGKVYIYLSGSNDATTTKKNLIADKRHKYLPIDNPTIIDTYLIKQLGTTTIVTECCWLKIIYTIYPMPHIVRNVVSTQECIEKIEPMPKELTEQNDFKKELDNVNRNITKLFGVPSSVFKIEDKTNED